MIISTTNFGKLEFEDDMVIRFDEGLPGFEDEHELVISMGAGDIGDLVETIKKTIIDQNEN